MEPYKAAAAPAQYRFTVAVSDVVLVARAALAVHADGDAVGLERGDELGAGELAALSVFVISGAP